MLKKGQVSHVLKTKAIFLFLLPLFFVFHGFILNYGSIPVADAFMLALLYIGIACLLTGIGWLFYRDLLKASLFAFILIGYHFFFGDLLGILKNRLSSIFLLRYRVIVPVSLFFFLFIAIWLKKRKKSPAGIVFYLNTLLALLIIIDAGRLAAKTASPGKSKTFQPGIKDLTVCNTCRKPDIFLIIPDEYAGNTALKNIFQYDNAMFENELRTRGFHISGKSTSNYNLTPFSVASTLNMDYINIQGGTQNYETVSYSYSLIKNSRVLQYLLANNYQFYNCSVFNFDGQPANEYGAFLPYGARLITEKTFTGRLLSDFRSDILSGKLAFTSLQKKFAYKYLHFNDAVIERTQKTAALRTAAPKFVYTHLMMPHYPSYFDSKGNLVPLEKVAVAAKAGPEDYLEYLKYSNGRLLQLVDYILEKTPAPPVIMLLSDHGYRGRKIKAKGRYDFINLNAIYLPDKKKDSLFNDSITNVNQFRTLFNSLFAQHLPLLKDSTINVLD